MKTSSGPGSFSSTLVKGLPKGYFSKCGGKGTATKAAPVKERHGSHVTKTPIKERLSKSVEEVSEFETNCSEIEAPQLKKKLTSKC